MQLRAQVVGETTIKYVKKPALHASVCAGCGVAFQMKEWCNEEGRGMLRGTFDRGAINPHTGKGDGNQLGLEVCSFKCAHDLFNGGWKKIEHYAHFVEAGATLVRGEVCITNMIKTSAQLIEEWEKAPERDGSTVGVY